MSRLGRNRRRRRVVGVVVDGDRLLGVELRRRRFRRLRVRGTASVEIPHEAWADSVTADPEVLAQALRTLWSEGRFTTSKVALGMGGRETMLHPILVPRAAADVVGYARSQLAAHFSTDLEDAIVDHLPVDADRRDDTAPEEVLAVAVRADIVEPVAEAVRRAGLKLVSVDAASAAIAGAIDAEAPASGRDVVVAVGENRTTVVVRVDGRPHSVRVVGPAADPLPLRPTAGDLAGGADDPWLDAHDAVEAEQQRRFSAAADAVAAAIHFDPRPDAGIGVPSVVLTGALGRHDALQHSVATASGATVAIASPPPWWTTGKRRRPLDDSTFDRFVEPAGVAHAWLTRAGTSFDLMPPSVLQTRDHRRELAVGLLLAALVGGGCGYGLVVYRAELGDAGDELAVIEGDVAALSRRLDDLAPVDEAERARAARLGVAAELLGDDLWWGRILHEVAVATGDDASLTDIALVRPLPVGDDGAEDGMVVFEGRSVDQAGVGSWLDAVAETGVFEDLWLVRSSVADPDDLDGPVEFRVEARLSSGARSPRAGDPSAWLVDLTGAGS